MKSDTATIFLSYSWKDKDIVNPIDTQLTQVGFNVVRDIRDIGTWKSIKEYMATIREHDYIVMVITSNYLKSPNCMYEVMELMKENDYKDRILAVVTDEANIYSPHGKASYINYWQNETQELQKVLAPIQLQNITELSMEYRKYKEIESSISAFLDVISDRNNPRIANAVEEIIKKIKENKKQKKTQNIVATSEKDSSIGVEMNLAACHYEFLHYAVTDKTVDFPKSLIGIKKIEKGDQIEPYDLPMLECTVTNLSSKQRRISVPFIEGHIVLNGNSYTGIGFPENFQEQNTLAPGESVVFHNGMPVMVEIISALLAGEIENIYVDDNFGNRYYANPNQLKEISAYFKEYCSDTDDMKNRFDNYYK